MRSWKNNKRRPCFNLDIFRKKRKPSQNNRLDKINVSKDKANFFFTIKIINKNDSTRRILHSIKENNLE
jgi:hypothetical protein